MGVVLSFGIELRMDDFEIGACHHLTLSNRVVSVQHLSCRQDTPYFTHKAYINVSQNSNGEQPFSRYSAVEL